MSASVSNNAGGEMPSGNTLSRDVVMTVATLCFLGFTNAMVVISITTTLLLFTNHVNFTTTDDTSTYVIAHSIGLITPTFAAIALGLLSSRLGTGLSMLMVYVALGLGTLVMIVARVNRYLFVLAYAMCSVSQAQRVLRYVVLGRVVPLKFRSTALAVHQMSFPLGLFCAPLIWIFFQQWRFEKVIIPSVLVVDRFTMLFSFSFCVIILSAGVTYWRFCTGHHADGAVPTAVSTRYGSAQVVTSTGEHVTDEDTVDTSLSGLVRNARFVYFCILFVCVRFSFSIGTLVIQPALIIHFRADDAEVGRIFSLSALFIFLAPVIAAAMSRVVQDRVILLTGLVVAATGMMLYAPLVGAVTKWQAVCGYVCVLNGTMMCSLSIVSIFSKKMGKRFSSAAMGYMWGFGGVLPVTVQVLFSHSILSLFSSWLFVVLAVPGLVGLSMVVSPPGWRLLDTQNLAVKASG